MTPSISIEHIDATLSNLQYRSETSIKSRLVKAIRQRYVEASCVHTLTSIPLETLIDALWDTGGDPRLVNRKRKNLNSVRSSVNADLERLYRSGDNPDGITISPDYVFALSDEARDKALAAFLEKMPQGAPADLDEISRVLNVINDLIDQPDVARPDDPAERLHKLAQMKDLLQGLARKIDPAETLSKGDGNGGKAGDQGRNHGPGGDPHGDDSGGSQGLDGSGQGRGAADTDGQDFGGDIPPRGHAKEAMAGGGGADANGTGMQGADPLDGDGGVNQEGYGGAPWDKDATADADDEDDLEVVALLDEVDPEAEDPEADDLEEVLEDPAPENLELEDLELEDQDEVELVEEIDAAEGSEDGNGQEDGAGDKDADDERFGSQTVDHDNHLDAVESGHGESPGLPPKKARILAEAFNRSLAAMDKFFNQYLEVPAGRYVVGAKTPQKGETAEHAVSLDAFYIGKFPVTNALYEVFVENTGYVTTAEKLGFGLVYKGRCQTVSDPQSGRSQQIWRADVVSETIEGACWFQPEGPGSTIHGRRNHPVVQISLHDALAFAAWTGKRLPFEEEWEAASRTAKGSLFPWGDDMRHGACNIEDSGLGTTTPVDAYVDSGNDIGIVDTLGNVQEWVVCTPKAAPHGKGSPACVAKGGSWISTGQPYAHARLALSPESHSNILGFRCVAA